MGNGAGGNMGTAQVGPYVRIGTSLLLLAALVLWLLGQSVLCLISICAALVLFAFEVLNGLGDRSLSSANQHEVRNGEKEDMEPFRWHQAQRLINLAIVITAVASLIWTVLGR